MRYSNPGYRFSFIYKKGWGDGYIYLITPKRRIFPSGLIYIAEEILQRHHVPYTIQDLRTQPTLFNSIPLISYQLRDYQQAMEKICLECGSGVVRAATGAGKTAVMASILGKYNGIKRIVYVRKLDLMAQTIKVLERELGIPIGRVGGGIINIQELSVVMIPTAARALDEKYVKYVEEDEEEEEDDQTVISATEKLAVKDYIENTQCFIIDECHCVSSESAQMVSRYSKKAYYRLGFSATPWRTDGTDILINAVTGPKIIDIPASILIERGFLVPPRVHFYRIANNVQVPKDYQAAYTECIVENKERNEKIVSLTKFLVEKGERPIILVQRQKHGQLLEDMLNAEGMLCKFIFGKSSLTERAFTLDQFESGAVDVVIGSSILQEGIDVPCITALVNASAGKSSSAYYQKIGRAIRPFEHKTRAIIIDFLDEAKWFKKHSQERIKILKTEPLYQVKVQT
jgi:superfamily II DNA or RNA helicase